LTRSEIEAAAQASLRFTQELAMNPLKTGSNVVSGEWLVRSLGNAGMNAGPVCSGF
jgi:hypothetical protein